MANSPLLATLQQRLETAAHYDASVRGHMTAGEPIKIRHTGRAISSAYEHLRNVAEYAEEHLILQRSIRRFYKRTLFIVKYKPEDVGRELIAELILAGYIPNGRYGNAASDSISKLATEYMNLYDQLRHQHISAAQARDWILAILSSKTTDLMRPHTYDPALVSFVCDYFMPALPRQQLVQSSKEAAQYDDALYVAVHLALLKSDLDIVRTELLHIHAQNTSDLANFIAWNYRAEELYTAAVTQRLKRIMQRNIAPFHILRELAASNTSLYEIIPDQEQFTQAYGHQIQIEYQRVAKRLNTGILKSIGFLFLTKMLIGLAIEVPFDRYTQGHIILMPLSINLLFPPLYMATIRLSISLPSSDNAQATTEFIEQLLYGEHQPALVLPKRYAPYPLIARLFFTVLALVPFAVIVSILTKLYFNALQMAIFFVFFSTASYLGFRLSSLVRELKMTRQEVGTLAIIRDLFYLPFILVGQWLSSKYSQINVVGEMLDLIIELPLKTVLGLVRQSVRFLNEKHQELY